MPYLRTYPSLKVWIPGCATGEEVYSLAILLREEGLLDRTLIYATDINPEALSNAEAGIYDLDRFADFSKAYREAAAAPPSRTTIRPGTTRRSLTRRCARASSSPTTASPPTVSSPSFTSSHVATSLSTSTAPCRTTRLHGEPTPQLPTPPRA